MLLSSDKGGGTSDTGYPVVSLGDTALHEIRRPQQDKSRMTMLQEVPARVRSSEADGIPGAPGAGEADGERVFNGDRVSDSHEEVSPGGGRWGWSHNSVHVLDTLNCTPTNG